MKGIRLHNDDCRKVRAPENKYLLTEAPNQPKEYIEDCLSPHSCLRYFVFCNYNLNMPPLSTRYTWSTWSQMKNYLIPSIIETFTRPGDIIFDPFMGYGFIGEIALGLERRYIGIEIEKTIYEVAKSRLEFLAGLPNPYTN